MQEGAEEREACRRNAPHRSPMIKDYFLLAFGNLKHRGLRSWLTILGVFIGIAAVVSLISLGQGLESAITGQFSTLSADRLTIQNSGTGFGPPGSTSVKKLNEHDLNVIKRVSGISEAIPRIIRIVSFQYNGVRTFEYASNIPDNQENAEYMYDSLNFEVAEGKLLAANDRGNVLLGSDFAETQRYGKDLQIGSKVLVQGREFRVQGFLEKTGTFQMNAVVFMTEKDLKEVLDIGDEIDIIIVQVDDTDKVEKAAEDIERVLRRDRGLKEGEEDFSVQTPLQALESVNLILNIINIIIVGIAAISLLVGGIGIANSMFTSVLERKKEIGVMKAVGAKNSDILWIFLIESGLIGLVGGIVGALLGLAFAFSVSAIANNAFNGNILDVSISYPLLLAALAFAFFIGIISGLIPALQASKLRPVEALRG